MSAVIIDYGMGNVSSVQKALRYLNIDSVISDSHEDIQKAKYLILPGVGAFPQGMQHLQESGLAELLTEEVLQQKKPFFGICLGMQLIASTGTEIQECSGLGWIPGKIERIQSDQLRVPHLGWNTVTAVRPSEVFIPVSDDYYFIHSYHFVAENSTDIAATVHYNDTLVAALERENIFATQFHPEKSQEAGLQLLQRFFQKYA
jgi:glutamine amidotransferase